MRRDEVATLAAQAAPEDTDLVLAAVLHDTLEDTDAEYEELMGLFGDEVTALVAEVTDDKSLPKAERKRLQVLNAPKKSDRAKILKLCDKASNLRAITVSPPAWSADRKLKYLQWARDVAAGLKGVNTIADEMFERTAEACAEALRLPGDESTGTVAVP